MSGQYLTIEQVAERLQVERQTVLKAIRFGPFRGGEDFSAVAYSAIGVGCIHRGEHPHRSDPGPSRASFRVGVPLVL